MSDILFYLCAGTLYVLSLITGKSYIEISVYINVYFQSILLLGTTVTLLYHSCKLLKKYRLIFILLLPWIAIQLAAFFIFSKKYLFLPNTVIFNETMAGLQNLAKFLGVTYNEINIILYVYGYGAIILVNLSLIKLINKLAGNLEKSKSPNT